MSNADKPAYPVHGELEGDDPRNQILSGGLTKREIFAMAAMQGMLSACQGFDGSQMGQENLAKCAVKMADNILKQL